MKEPQTFLTLTISKANRPKGDPDISIGWENNEAPRRVVVRDKIYNAIQALLSELGPVPKGGWSVSVRQGDVVGFFKLPRVKK